MKNKYLYLGIGCIVLGIPHILGIVPNSSPVIGVIGILIGVINIWIEYNQ